MKCPYCGYDKIQPNFNFCPQCKRSLKEHNDTKQVVVNEVGEPQEKGFINRAISRWTYERAAADPVAYANWAQRNPNDNRVFLERWNSDGNDLVAIRRAIAEANRPRQERPAADTANTISTTGSTSGATAVNDEYITDAVAIVRNKAIWKLQPGELARHIAPDEWAYVSEHLQGLVIEEGTSAIIYIDGEEVAQMSSGMYVFDNKHAAAAELEAHRRRSEQQGIFSRIADGIYRFFTGHKREESASQKEERRRRVQQIISRMKKDTMIDVYLKSDRVFPAIFGEQHLSASPEGYKPYVLQSRYLDVSVGVSMQMRIDNFKSFIANYFVGCKSVTIADVVKSADTAVLSVLRYRLRDVEISERGLDEDTSSIIKDHLKRNLSNILYGVAVVEVLDIATSNEQLARFRQVEEQLYCSEREYDFLQRTNEFRNRIASEENDQKIREARSEQELRVQLDEVNKDNLLHTEEMEQFVSLLMNQKAIREATNGADLDKAMLEIERNKLISKEEFDIFKNDLANRTFDREQVSEQLRARSLMATALQKIEADKTISIAKIVADSEESDVRWETDRKKLGQDIEKEELDTILYGKQYVLERQKLIDDAEKARLANDKKEAEIQARRLDDEYEIEKKRREHEFDEQKKEEEYQRQHRDAEDALARLQRMMDMEQNTKDRDAQRDLERLRVNAELDLQKEELELRKTREDHEYELSKKNIEADVDKTRIQAESTMSADQLLGKNIASMDAAAQVKFAESFSHIKEAELIKANAEEREKLYQKMLEMAERNSANMQSVASDNAADQAKLMSDMLSAFKEMNMSQSMGQQNMVNTMMGAVQGVANGKVQDMQAMKEEYREEKHHAEARLDDTQKQSLNYTAHVKMSENAPNIKGGTSVNVNIGTSTCPGCGEPMYDMDMMCCPICGRDLK